MGNIILFESKEKCCGCGACMNVCPKSAITMQEDEYGFLYPCINEELCVECGVCKRVCAYQNDDVKNRPVACYAAVSKNNEQKMKSASGGIFAAFATKILSEGGVVFGAALEKKGDRFVIHHIGVDSEDKLSLLQGSKYVQSATEQTLKKVKSYLSEGKKVLYSGTPCQIAGLYGYLGKNYENLITVDLICHGVPNARFFNDYLKQESGRLKSKEITDYVFRDKKMGWGMNGRIDYVSAEGEIKSKYIPARLASYNTLFLDGLTYRENCYFCKYACENRPADVTIGDYWGIEKEHPELLGKNGYDESTGISCIIANTKKGQEFCKSMSRFLLTNDSTFEKIANRNGQLKYASAKPVKREKVINLYRKEGYVAVEKLFREKYKKQIIIHRIYNAIPRKIRIKIKGVIKK